MEKILTKITVLILSMIDSLLDSIFRLSMYFRKEVITIKTVRYRVGFFHEKFGKVLNISSIDKGIINIRLEVADETRSKSLIYFPFLAPEARSGDRTITLEVASIDDDVMADLQKYLKRPVILEMAPRKYKRSIFRFGKLINEEEFNALEISSVCLCLP